MNIKLLRRIQKQILKEPRQFGMRDWFTQTLYELDPFDMFDGSVELKTKIPNCGTAACVLGWAASIIKKQKPSCRTDLFAADRALEIHRRQRERLYYFSSWPAQFKKHTKEGTPAFARQAVKRIEHFIKTKGAE